MTNITKKKLTRDELNYLRTLCDDPTVWAVVVDDLMTTRDELEASKTQLAYRNTVLEKVLAEKQEAQELNQQKVDDLTYELKTMQIRAEAAERLSALRLTALEVTNESRMKYKRQGQALAADLDKLNRGIPVVSWVNGCDNTIPRALRYLANNDRPAYGNSEFNSEHLYQLANELERVVAGTDGGELKTLRNDILQVKGAIDLGLSMIGEVEHEWVVDMLHAIKSKITTPEKPQEDIKCYACQKMMTVQAHAEADGFCPSCGAEIITDEDE